MVINAMSVWSHGGREFATNIPLSNTRNGHMVHTCMIHRGLQTKGRYCCTLQWGKSTSQISVNGCLIIYLVLCRWGLIVAILDIRWLFPCQSCHSHARTTYVTMLGALFQSRLSDRESSSDVLGGSGRRSLMFSHRLWCLVTCMFQQSLQSGTSRTMSLPLCFQRRPL
jgi:hypothetical protein